MCNSKHWEGRAVENSKAQFLIVFLWLHQVCFLPEAEIRARSSLFLQRELVLSQKTDSLGEENPQLVVMPLPDADSVRAQGRCPAQHPAERGREGWGRAVSPGPPVSRVQRWPCQWVSRDLPGLPWLHQGDLGSNGEWACPWGLGPPQVASNPYKLKGGHVLAFLTKLKPSPRRISLLLQFSFLLRLVITWAGVQLHQVLPG